MAGLPLSKHPDLLVGLESPDDAGVFKMGEALALIQTVDILTPIVDDPHTFGQIAAANALSDVYAMGGKPLLCLNIVCFPIQELGEDILRDILLGALSKIQEAGALLIGGHSVEDQELKFGLAVTGTTHPQRFLANGGAQPGDVLVLTKALGTGIISTALKGEMASPAAVAMMSRSMTTLNRRAAELMMAHQAHACTDITGFGLLGHALEMARHSRVGLKFGLSRIPLLEGAMEYAGYGLVPGGTHRITAFVKCRVSGEVPALMWDILADPQTSGGLLIALPPDQGERLVAALRAEGFEHVALIGEVVPEPQGQIVLEP